jgi:hypothetical protein
MRFSNLPDWAQTLVGVLIASSVLFVIGSLLVNA